MPDSDHALLTDLRRIAATVDPIHPAATLHVTDPLVTVTGHATTFRAALLAVCRLARDPNVDEPQRRQYQAVAEELADALHDARPAPEAR